MTVVTEAASQRKQFHLATNIFLEYHTDRLIDGIYIINALTETFLDLTFKRFGAVIMLAFMPCLQEPALAQPFGVMACFRIIMHFVAAMAVTPSRFMTAGRKSMHRILSRPFSKGFRLRMVWRFPP